MHDDVAVRIFLIVNCKQYSIHITACNAHIQMACDVGKVLL